MFDDTMDLSDPTKHPLHLGHAHMSSDPVEGHEGNRHANHGSADHAHKLDMMNQALGMGYSGYHVCTYVS